ncbi:sensor histidine kinase [Chitinimonas sp. BJYL2]|uniref:sensor histidine kinase n=1 Tax=Chitinimonas sp. BJYL2 TaxID=2976696 RepID=UPI0022B4810F|nr:sensor histidine kinase [Chitinimonas sp. BJYL2]
MTSCKELTVRTPIGWEPMFHLIWLGFLFTPMLDWGGGAGYRNFHLQETLLAIALYVPIHFVTYYASGPKLWIGQALTFLIATWLVPYNPAAHTLFLYAGFPGERATIKESVIGMLAVMAGAFAVFQYYSLGGGYYGILAGILFGVGGAMLGEKTSRRAKAVIALKDVEIERIAKVAERERIARDLHDLLGHTLSLIAIKAELAHKLAEREPVRASGEMQEVAQVARSALAEVRQAIVGLRSVDLIEAIRRAESTLVAAGIAVELQIDAQPKLDAAAEHALAQAVVEASTNIVRHAKASEARLGLRLRPDGGAVLLTVHDNGPTDTQLVPGHGLTGMRERLDAVGGTLTFDRQDGLLLTASVPLAAA